MGYEQQGRATAEAYAHYFAGMNKSMRQKVALVSTLFPSRGAVADMGSGSGEGSYHLARLYPDVQVIGVDIDPHAVEYAGKTYQAANLRYQQGDIAAPLFEAGTLDSLLNSSVLHHVTSFNDFSLAKIDELLDHQTAALKPGGYLAIRDFVAPPDNPMITLDLPTGATANDLATMASADLFRAFCSGFRSSVHRAGVPLQEATGAAPGWQRFVVDLRTATEFVLRKDYRQDWDAEILEEYTYFHQEQFESSVKSRGMRLVISKPIYNPWIVKNRFVGQFQMHDQGHLLPYPPTNYIIIAQKTTPAMGIGFRVEPQTNESEYLQLQTWRDESTSDVWDLIRRPDEVEDLIPWFVQDGRLQVIARKAYPRPLSAMPSALAGRTRTAGYVVEPVCRVVNRQSIAETLTMRAGIAAQDQKQIADGLIFLPSPGGIDELVTCRYVKVEAGRPITPVEFAPDFATPGETSALDAAQTLRTCQVGGMTDHRLEIAIYDLLWQEGLGLGPWIADELDIGQQQNIAHIDDLPVHDAHLFTRCDSPADFLALRTASITEFHTQDLATATLDYVVPTKTSIHTATVIPFCNSPDGVLVGLEYRHLPAASSRLGHSGLWCVPGWRIPAGIQHLQDLAKHAFRACADEFHLHVADTYTLGGSYLPTPGITPEIVFPLAVCGEPKTKCTLQFFPLSRLISLRREIRDGHLLVSAFRLYHALQEQMK